MKSKVNFHIHTTHSDGGKTVAEVVENLHKAGVEYFAITDHDTVRGSEEAAGLAGEYGLKTFNGVELSCCFSSGEVGMDASYVCHIVGLGFDPVKMEAEINGLLSYKIDRIAELSATLIADGYNLDEKVLFGNTPPKRRDEIGKQLIANGYAKNMNEAFELILNSRKYSGYAKNVPSIEEGIDIIHKCGGLAVWAHPFDVTRGGKKKLTEEQVTRLSSVMKNYGVDGIEVYYQKYTPEQIDFLDKIWKVMSVGNSEIYKSIGTDYHLPSFDKKLYPEYIKIQETESIVFDVDGIMADESIVEKLLSVNGCGRK